MAPWPKISSWCVINKIFVTGNAGSGKSTTARKIATRLGLRYHSLDGIVWKEHWQKVSDDEQHRQISELIAQKSWVIDGVDYEIMHAADTVIFLDIPRRSCFWRAAKRNRKYLFKSRPELPAHCPEVLIIPTLIKIIWRFPSRVRPKLLREKALRTGASFIHIKNQAGIEDYLRSI